MPAANRRAARSSGTWYPADPQIGVKFSTHGVRINPERARFLAPTNYVDVQVSLDGTHAEANDHVRGPGSYDTELRALQNLQKAIPGVGHLGAPQV